MARVLVVVVALVLRGGAARANPDLACPAALRQQASYVASSGVPPEAASPPWAVASDGSLVEVAPIGGEDALHVVDDGLPATAEGFCQPGALDGGVTYVLEETSLLDADVYGIEARLLLIDECVPSGIKETAVFGVLDGARMAAVEVFDAEAPKARLLVATVKPKPGEPPAAPLPSVDLAAGVYHTLTVRVVRGERPELLGEGWVWVYRGLPIAECPGP